MSISENLSRIRKEIPENVNLVCVSKFHPDKAILDAYAAGERIFGESKVQELSGKYERLPKDIQWHFIGHLQTNKIKFIVPFVELIHGVDSYKLLQEINKQASKVNRIINCLLQIHIASEETKFGFAKNELMEMLNDNEFKKLKHINICGIMGMASFTNNSEKIGEEFNSLKTMFDNLKNEYFSEHLSFNTISMGMSDDYLIAIKEGSTMVRIGSSIFGRRNY